MRKRVKQAFAGAFAMALAVANLNLIPAQAEEAAAADALMEGRSQAGAVPATAFTDKVAAGDITLDGNLDEEIWSDLKYEVDKRVVSTTLNNTCKFSTAWDDENLYIGIAVKDETIVTEPLGTDIYQNDGVEVLIDPDNDGVYDARTAHFMIQVADGKWTVWGGEDKWNEITDTYQNSDMKYAFVDGGYTVEVKIPFADMGITEPKAGTAMKFAVCNNDNDDTAQIDRQELHWVENFNAGDAATWGNVFLNSEGAQMISQPGTAEADGILSEGYGMQTAAVNAESYTVQAASLCDSEYLYLAYEITLTDPGQKIAEVLEKDEGAELQVFLSGDNDQIQGRSPNNRDLDLIINLHKGEVAYFRSCDADSGDAEGKVQYAYLDNSKAKMGYTDNGAVRTVELAVPWENLNPDRDYLTVIGMETAVKIGEQYTRWSNAPSPWEQSQGYGIVVLNNQNVAAPENVAPSVKNQINSYSIPQGGSASGKIEAEDANGDALTYRLVSGADSAEGTFTLDSVTGEWSYTTPNAEFMKPEGVNYIIEISDSAGESARSRVEIRVEHAATNITWYVDGDNGNDSNDGLTEDTAFKTIAKAHDMTNPGDTVLIYESENPYGWNEEEYMHSGCVQITRSGLPEAYITYKAAPGHTPVVKSNGEWNTIYITASYIKLEGIRVEGIADQVSYEEAWKIVNGKMVPEDDPAYIPTSGREVSIAQTNGICITPEKRIKDAEVTMDNIFVPHHVEVRNCTVDKVSAAGISALEANYITIENNTVTNCGWWEMYAGSGISVLDSMDTDSGGMNEYNIIIRNNSVAGCRHFMPWLSLKRLSDGNGIIIDSNNHAVVSGVETDSGYPWGVLPYEGRTLVANNLCYENGGSGMHVFDSNHVDMINNTIYSNVATTWLGYSDFYASQAIDINMFNNIVYSRTGNPMNITSSSNEQVVYDHNLFYNYDANQNNLGVEYKGTTVGGSNQYGVDPMFVEVPVIDNSVDVSAYPAEWTEEMKANAEKAHYSVAKNYDINQYSADFTVAENSPALGAGNEEWSAKVGNTDNRLGIFGTIGAEQVTEKPEPEETPDPEEKPEPEETPDPEEKPTPTETPDPEEKPTPTETPDPEEKPTPTETPNPEEKPSPAAEANQTGKPEKTNEAPVSAAKQKGRGVKTGDNSAIGLYLTAGIISLGVLTVAGVVCYRKKRQNDQSE